MSNLVVSQVSKLGAVFGMENDGAELLNVLKATAFKGQVSDAQMSALMVVANQYKLNPFTREIYAFPDRQNGIIPVVGVDGWARIINEHPQFDGMEFDQNEESCTCIIYRKDRGRPIKITEWLAECKRENAQPWKTHPRRMMRHKSLIQCARIAFGFVGIYDPDEAERIAESRAIDARQYQEKPLDYSQPMQGNVINVTPVTVEKDDIFCSDEVFDKYFPEWKKRISSGRFTFKNLLELTKNKYKFTDAQIEAIKSIEVQP